MPGTLHRAPREIVGSFVSARPGDIVIHPRTGLPLATITAVTSKVIERRRKPAKYVVCFEIEDFPYQEDEQP